MDNPKEKKKKIYEIKSLNCKLSPRHFPRFVKSRSISLILVLRRRYSDWFIFTLNTVTRTSLCPEFLLVTFYIRVISVALFVSLTLITLKHDSMMEN